MAFVGVLTFNPVTDTIISTDGKLLKFSDPSSNELSPLGYDPGQNTFWPPPADHATPFKPWEGKTLMDLPVLIKVRASVKFMWTGLLGVIIGNHNYSEGSFHEHTALEPHYLGGLAIIIHSFAHLHKPMKKWSMLTLTFANPEDHDKVLPSNKVDILGLELFAPSKNLTLIAKHGDGTMDEFPLTHSFNKGQIEWFKASSALLCHLP
ncbi:aconitase C-terminal domain protein [Melanogaster broomeanus]|nr:aconitase C-terminal domain protein [Melanogaster broomeanus]